MYHKCLNVITIIMFSAGMFFTGQLNAAESNPANKNNTAEADVYTDALLLGLSPQQSVKEISEQWQPFIHYIQEQTNYPFSLSTSFKQSTFENRLYSGKFDLAFVNPVLFIKANDYVGYMPLVREEQKRLQAIIVVAKESEYNSITDLMDLQLVTPAKNFEANILARLNLQAKGMQVSNSLLANTGAVYAAVINGKADAGGGDLKSFNNLPDNMKGKLRIIWTSEEVMPYVLMVHPRVNATVKDRILEAILNFKDTPEGALFYKTFQMKPFIEAKNDDWKDIRQLMGQ